MKKQGYNSRLDESLGAKHGKKSQSMKDRRGRIKSNVKKKVWSRLWGRLRNVIQTLFKLENS